LELPVIPRMTDAAQIQAVTNFWKVVSENIKYIMDINDLNTVNKALYNNLSDETIGGAAMKKIRDAWSEVPNFGEITLAFQLNMSKSSGDAIFQNLQSAINLTNNIVDAPPQIQKEHLEKQFAVAPLPSSNVVYQGEQIFSSKYKIQCCLSSIPTKFSQSTEHVDNYYRLSKQFKYPRGFQIVKHIPRSLINIGNQFPEIFSNKVGYSFEDGKLTIIMDGTKDDLSSFAMCFSFTIVHLLGSCPALTRNFAFAGRIGSIKGSLTFDELKTKLLDYYITGSATCVNCGLMEYNCEITNDLCDYCAGQLMP
jgi:hypothetical protein